MGCAISNEGGADKKRSDEIDKTLAAESASKSNEIKLLLLGEFCVLLGCAHRACVCAVTLDRQAPSQKMCFCGLVHVEKTH